MTTIQKNPTEWKRIKARENKAQEYAAEILDILLIDSIPIDPIIIAQTEVPQLQIFGDDFKEQFDGQLEYHDSHKKFLLFYNTKYNTGLPNGTNHPRTRFSISHELGHYYLDKHRIYLMQSGKTHPSKSEFSSNIIMEREADAFAASLLMPKNLFKPKANKEELTTTHINDLSTMFQTSRLSTAIRSVQLSDFPCAVAGVRQGIIAWQFHSSALIEGGCYPKLIGKMPPASTKKCLEKLQNYEDVEVSNSEYASQWFWLYGRAQKKNLTVYEQYLSVPVMDTLVVLLSIPEEDLFD